MMIAEDYVTSSKSNANSRTGGCGLFSCREGLRLVGCLFYYYCSSI